jgi:hypothetical protein
MLTICRSEVDLVGITVPAHQFEDSQPVKPQVDQLQMHVILMTKMKLGIRTISSILRIGIMMTEVEMIAKRR